MLCQRTGTVNHSEESSCGGRGGPLQDIAFLQKVCNRQEDSSYCESQVLLSLVHVYL